MKHASELAVPPHLPDHLREIWEELADGISITIGLSGMEALCTQVYRMRDAQRRITEEGTVVADDKGRPVEHPALSIERKAQKEVRKWTKEYSHPFT